MYPKWFNPQSTDNPVQLQGSGQTVSLQGGSGINPKPNGELQVATNTPAPKTSLGATTAVAPAAAAATGGGVSNTAAIDAARARTLRGEITNIANAIKDIFNSRYGQVDAAAGEQTGKLNDRFATESSDITKQVEGENQKVGAGAAAVGTFDSSYRGNNVDTITQAGEGQIRDLGTELQDNIAKIASWITSQKAGFDAQKGGIDSILARLGQETDPDALSQIRATLDTRIADLKAGSADNNTQAQNAAALNSVVPTNVRAQQIKTTLSQIAGGNADVNQKSAIGKKLIQSADLTPQEQNELLTSFQGELASSEQKKTQPTA